MTDRKTLSVNQLLVELFGVEDAIRVAPTTQNPLDPSSALCPQLLDLLTREITITADLRRQGASWESATEPAWWPSAAVRA